MMKHTMNGLCRRKIGFGLLMLPLMAFTGNAVHAQGLNLANGQLVISRVGDGSATLGSTGTAVFLDQFNTTATGQTAFTSIALPTVTNGSNNPFTVSGSATSEGALSLSTDSGGNNYLFIAGYNAASGTTGVASSTTIQREVARVTVSDGTIDTTTVLKDATSGNNAYSGNNIRSVVSTDGATFYTAGASEGVRSGTVDNPSTTLVSTSSTNNRIANIFNGNLYVSTGSGSRGIYQFTGLPTGTGNTATKIIDTGSTSSPYDFFFADPNTVYVADDRSSATGGGLQKYISADNGATFSFAYTLSGGTGLRGLTTNGFTDANGNLTFYAVTNTSTANSLVSISDNLANTVSPGTVTFTTLATAAPNTIFRGVEFIPTAIAPTPEPGGMASLLIGFCALGLLVARRRRAGLNQTLT